MHHRFMLGIEDPEARTRETAEAGLVKGVTACNRSACQVPLSKDTRMWNTSTEAYYCPRCAWRINDAGISLGTAPLCLRREDA